MIPRNNIGHAVPEIYDIPPINADQRDTALRVPAQHDALDLTDALGLGQGDDQ